MHRMHPVCSRDAAAEREAMAAQAVAACPLLLLSDDELEVVGHQISDALHPAVAGALAACNLNLWRVMRALLAKLQPRHTAARALAAKVGWSCAALSEATVMRWGGKHLDAAEMATLGMLFSTGALARVERLFLGGNRSGPAVGSALLAELGSGAAPRLTVLSLHGTNLGTAGAAALAAALGRGALPKLEKLFIGSNEISDEALAALAPTLRRRPALKRLFLSNNHITDAGVAALFDNLGATELKQLELLDLGDNQITDSGCVTLIAAIQGGRLPTLGRNFPAHFPIPGNPTSAAAGQAVRDALMANNARGVS